VSVTTILGRARASGAARSVIAAVAATVCAALLAGCTFFGDPARGSVAPPTPYPLAQSPSSVLVVADRLPGYERYANDVLVADTDLLSHFTPDVRSRFADKVTAADAAAASAVVYIGDSEYPAPPGALQAMRAARRLVLIGNHLAQFHAAGVAFAHVAAAGNERAPKGTVVAYDGKDFPFAGSFQRISAKAGATTIASFDWSSGTDGFIVKDGDATYVNGQMDFSDDDLAPAHNGYQLVIADDLARALGAVQAPDGHIALLRLEDVSVQTPVDNLRDIVTELATLHVRYGIGVIPDQLIEGEHLESLAQDRGLVTVLLWAQAHGATIVLHGLHHSYHSAEDFEFWDAVHDRPLPYDSASWMSGRIEEGLRDERAVGLDPVMWETPHYAASPTDYSVTAKYFTTVWEQRRPLGWAPWIMQRDQYGQRVLPEDLGYVALDPNPDESLGAQMDRARALLVCRGCIAAGFLHPTTVSPDTVRAYVLSLRAMGYTFADPRRYIAPGSSGESLPSGPENRQ
jgi:uncharacterized protein YdaL